MAMNKHHVKGVLISIVFIAAGLVASLYGVNLGRTFWIALVLLLLVLVIIYPVWLTVRSSRDNNRRQ
jgi:Mg2+ and Co2+ transporter CorA